MAQLKDVINNGLLKLPTSPNTLSVGNVWFDEVEQKAKYSWCGGAWSSGGALITARNSLAGSGTQNAGLAFGGYSPGFSTRSCTEEYDGTSWATSGALITARCELAGAGTQNAGLAFGGSNSSTEEYNIGMQTHTL